jgi:hypothetical protein
VPTLRLRDNILINLPLLVDDSQSEEKSLVANTSIGHDGVVKTDSTPRDPFNVSENSISEVGTGQICITHNTNGVYLVRLNVIDSNGAVTTKSVDVTINNVAPEIVSITKPDKIDEGRSISRPPA